MKNYNEYRIEDNLIIGKASNSDDEFCVDLCDFDKIKDISWSVRTNRVGMKEICGWGEGEKEIVKLFGLVGRKGYALIPLSLYFSGSRVKMEVGLCVGKKLYDKRDSEAERSAARDIDRAMKGARE